jgi:argininosuccinate lyase
VARDVPFREAHEIVGRIVRDLLVGHRDFSSLTPAEWRGYHDRLDADAAGRITSRGSVEARRTPQSTAPNAVAVALAQVHRWVADRILPVTDADGPTALL